MEQITEADRRLTGKRRRRFTRQRDFAGRKFVLAGGLHAGNVNKGIQLFHPDVVDVSSGVENENGKDEALIKQFVACVKEEAKERKER